MTATREQFSVCRFFNDGTNEYVCRFVGVQEALLAFNDQCHWATHTGVVSRVIITDGGDCINAEWVFGSGLVYPPKPEQPKH